MKLAVPATLMILLLSGLVFAGTQDFEQHPTCDYCGMHRVKFAHSRMLITYEDGGTVGTCSLRCAALELAIAIDRQPVSIQVGDYNSKRLIDAEQATWVVGGDRPGVMTRRAKWAFKEESDAQKFIDEHGGEQATAEQAISAAFVDMYADAKMIRSKRAAKKQKMMTH
ncbi:MAG: NosL family protein [Desulfuromonas sp.]|nr:MAG: NosL family protein [Desulfuromonas sp.]